MNIFYAPPNQIQGEVIELTEQEAKHASKALRYKEGDDITVVDGEGGRYEGQVQTVADNRVRIIVKDADIAADSQPNAVLGMSIIKKRDRLEFAVEKAVELGVKEIVLFRSEHAVKQNLRVDRLESIALSAMKQSLRSWLPDIAVFNNPAEVVQAYAKGKLIVAHKTEKKIFEKDEVGSKADALLLVGPEGGFSEKEIDYFKKEGAALISLGPSRLRTETAAITLLSQYHYSCLLNRT